MREYQFYESGAGDEAAITDLLAQTGLPGWIDLALLAAPGAQGMLHPRAWSRTLIARGPEGLAGMVTRSTFPGFLTGGAAPLSYLGHFRVAPEARRRVKLLRRAFDICRERFGSEPGWSFASLLDGNDPARRLLTSGLPGFPRLAAIGRYQTVVLRSLRPGAEAEIRRGTAADMGRVVAFHGSHPRPLAPVLAPDDLAEGRWPGLKPDDFLLAERDGRLVGIVALWDQRALRRLQVRGYRPPLSYLRGAVNAVGRLTGFPHLPRLGDMLSLAYLSFLTVEPGDDATAARLVRAARRLSGERGLDCVALGLGADDPLLPQLRTAFRAATYGSCIYAVSWQDDAMPEPSAFARLRPDVGLL